MKLLKRFHYSELYTHNASITNPSILDGEMLYRDGMDSNPFSPRNDDTKLLKICDIDNKFNTSNYKTIYNTETLEALSDAMWFKYKDKKYIRVTKVDTLKRPYECKIDLLDRSTLKLLNLKYDSARKQEKNWIFFTYNDDIYISYSLWNNKHKILKCNLETKQISNFRETEYVNLWPSSYGEVRNSSNFAFQDGYMWGLIHSHTFPSKDWSYYIGIIAITAKPPFRVVYISSCPLFNLPKKSIIFPMYLNFTNDKMIIGLTLTSPYYMDILEISKDEINHHLVNNISYNYPVDWPFFKGVNW